MTLQIITWALKLLAMGVLYSESIAGRGIAILISCLSIAGPVDCFNRAFEENIDLQFLLVGYSPPLAMPLKQGTQLIFTHVIMLVTFLLQLIIYPLILMKQTSLKLPKIM